MTLAAAGAAAVTLIAAGHAPKTGTHWPYSVSVQSGGKPAAARLTVEIVDPIGGAHPVDFGLTTKPVKNWAFKGTFHDFVIWPGSSRGIPLTLRLTVTSGGAKKVI